jgi:hypothetical protein
MAPPPLPPDYTGGAVDSSSTMGWINPAPETVSHVASTPSTNAHGDDWGGWGATPAAAVTPSVKAENGSDPWDSQQQAGSSDASKVTGQNASSTNQVIGCHDFPLIISLTFLNTSQLLLGYFIIAN